MKSYDTYNKKDKKEDNARMSSVADFFRKEINETRTFTRNLTASKSYNPKISRLVKSAK